MNKFTVCFVMFYYVLIFETFGNEIPTHWTFFIELFNEVVEFLWGERLKFPFVFPSAFRGFPFVLLFLLFEEVFLALLPFARLPFWVPELTFALAFSEFLFSFLLPKDVEASSV